MKAASNTKDIVEVMAVEVLPNGKDHTGKDEMNLAEFPITVLGDRPPKGVKTLVFNHGKGKLIVTGSDAFGLPTALDDDVILALIQLTKLKNDFTEPTVNFTRYELLRLLGWANEGKNYRRIDESLKRWTGVTLFYEKCWWDNRAKRNVNANIHIIDEVVIFDGSKGSPKSDTQATLPLSTFTWNSRFMESFQSDNLKDLDLDTYFSLKWMPSKRLYRFLDKRFYKRAELTFPIEEIAFTRVGLSRTYARNVAKIKEKLHPAIAELESIGFIEPLGRDERYFKDTDGWKVRVGRKKNLSALPEPPRQLEPPRLVTELVTRGVTQATSVELVQQFPAQAIEAKIEVFDWLMQSKDKRVAKSPAGYLVDSIRKDYATLKGFESKAQRQQREAAKLETERQAAEERRRQRATDAQEQADRQRVDAYLKQLSAEERLTLEAEVIAQASPETKANYESPQMARYRETLMLALLREYLGPKLRPELIPAAEP